MKNKYFIEQIILLLLFNYFSLISQELPPIQIFSPEEYVAGNQNWMISQGSNKNIYIANNEGLLTYNGSVWKLYSSPNSTIFRSVNVVRELIYTGCFMEFGYWKKNNFGSLEYTSLSSLLNIDMIEDEQIWNIINFDKWIVFQSFNRMYIYDLATKKINIINSKNRIIKIFKVDNAIFYQEFNGGIFQLENGIPRLFCKDEILKNTKIINIYKYKNDLILITDNKGFYIYKEGSLFKWKVKINDLLNDITIYSAIQLQNKNFVLGTISKGIIIINNKGNVIHQINQGNGLSNNTILSMFIDIDQNLWAGLDNGINVINLKSPITIFNDYKGVLGTVYCSIIYDNYLYLGTNQGLFYKNQKENSEFKLVEGTKGQVWSLVIYNNELFCGHNSGVFLINENASNLIAPILGTWDIKPIPTNKNLLMLGSFRGLSILIKKDNKWQLKNRIEGFDISSRFFEFGTKNNIWINHEYKGVYELTLNKDYTKVNKVVLDTVLKKGKNSGLVTYKNQIHYAIKDGVFKFDESVNTFKKDTLLSTIIENDNFISGKLMVDSTDKLWSFSKNYISYVSSSQLTNELNVNLIPISSLMRKDKVGYENISIINKNNYLLGTSDGYLKIDLSKIYKNEYSINIDRVYIINLEKIDTSLPLDEKVRLKNKQNSINFNYSVAEYDKFTTTEYQYKLKGIYDKWSPWSNNPSVLFENLKYNNYKFSVRARVGNIITPQKDYEFSINKPWFLSKTAVFIYIMTLIFLIFLTHRIFRWYYNKQHKNKQLTNEQLIMSIKNDKLNQDIESKNRELAISTMSIIKKNKVLSSIKKELTNNNINNENKSVIRLIDRNLNNEKDWKFFEEAFNNADKDFLNKVKKAHPNLTPNDLRFCAYLRLNLSSKEIAPLLNISVRSIEIKRYRLRKKMNLAHSKSLVKHILDI